MPKTTTKEKGAVKHTPGPWTTDDVEVRGDRGRVTICDVPGHDRQPDGRYLRANAHLIAAAPQLLAALKEAAPFVHAHAGPGDLKDKTTVSGRIEAALRKARGA